MQVIKSGYKKHAQVERCCKSNTDYDGKCSRWCVDLMPFTETSI